MYAVAISPLPGRPDGRQDSALVAGIGGSDATSDPGPAPRTAADHGRGRLTLPHLADRSDAAPHRAFRRRAGRKPEAWARAPLLPERDDAATDPSEVVRSPGGGLGIRHPPPTTKRRS